MVQMDLSIPHFLLYFFFSENIPHPTIDSLCLASGNLFLTFDAMCILEAFSILCVCMSYSPFQKSPVLFSHMYLTISFESEKLPGLRVVVSNSG